MWFVKDNIAKIVSDNQGVFAENQKTISTLITQIFILFTAKDGHIL